MNEFDPPVGRVGQRIQDVAVEGEGADHLPRLPRRVMERGVVEIAQIAAEPDQGAGKFRHRAFWSL